MIITNHFLVQYRWKITIFTYFFANCFINLKLFPTDTIDKNDLYINISSKEKAIKITLLQNLEIFICITLYEIYIHPVLFIKRIITEKMKKIWMCSWAAEYSKELKDRQTDKFYFTVFYEHYFTLHPWVLTFVMLFHTSWNLSWLKRTCLFNSSLRYPLEKWLIPLVIQVLSPFY